MGGCLARPAGGASHRGATAGRPGEFPSHLIGQIHQISPKAAKAFQKADITKDSEIQKLTREDLNELLPGHKNLKLRKIIDEKIKQSLSLPIDVDINKPEDSSDEHLRADSSRNPASVRELTEKINQVLNLLQALHHQSESGTENNTEVDSCQRAALGECLTILMEVKELLQASRHQPESGAGHTTEAAGSSTCPRSLPKTSSSDKPPHVAASNKKKRKRKAVVKVHCVVSGKTLDSHQTLLQQVKAQGGLELQETNDPDTCDVIILFCPIVSRMGTDIDAAMKLLPGVGDKAMIRVVLHHTFEKEFTVPRVPADSRVMYDVTLCSTTLKKDSCSVRLTTRLSSRFTLPYCSAGVLVSLRISRKVLLTFKNTKILDVYDSTVALIGIK